MTVHLREILVVDDEVGIRELLSEILQDEGYRVAVAENAQEARSYRARAQPALVLLDELGAGTAHAGRGHRSREPVAVAGRPIQREYRRRHGLVLERAAKIADGLAAADKAKAAGLQVVMNLCMLKEHRAL